MLRRGLVEGTAGNISARLEDGNLVITPSSVDYAEMALDDLVLVDPDGAVLEAKDGRSPSSEMQLHLACYQAFDDIGSVIHAIPCGQPCSPSPTNPFRHAVDEFAVFCGGEIRCAEYAASGTPDVGTNAVKALEGRAAALIANHGLVAVGPRPTRCCTSPPWSSAPPRSSGAQGLSAALCPSPMRSTGTSPRCTATFARTRCRRVPLTRPTVSARDTPANSVQTRSLARVPSGRAGGAIERQPPDQPMPPRAQPLLGAVVNPTFVSRLRNRITEVAPPHGGYASMRRRHEPVAGPSCAHPMSTMCNVPGLVAGGRCGSFAAELRNTGEPRVGEVTGERSVYVLDRLGARVVRFGDLDRQGVGDRRSVHPGGAGAHCALYGVGPAVLARHRRLLHRHAQRDGVLGWRRCCFR